MDFDSMTALFHKLCLPIRAGLPQRFTEQEREGLPLSGETGKSIGDKEHIAWKRRCRFGTFSQQRRRDVGMYSQTIYLIAVDSTH